MNGGTGLLDDLTGGGFTLIVREGDPRGGLGPEHLRTLERLNARLVTLDSSMDLDGRLEAWLADNAVHAVLVRPDFYVFGSAGSPADTPRLVEQLDSCIARPTREENR